ncbi:MAG: hypothetical protein ACREDR_23440 [Blastocatellia bacterium]
MKRTSEKSTKRTLTNEMTRRKLNPGTSNRPQPPMTFELAEDMRKGDSAINAIANVVVNGPKNARAQECENAGTLVRKESGSQKTGDGRWI